MMNERRLRLFLASAVSLLLGTSCGNDSEPLGGNEGPVGSSPSDDPARLDASARITLEGVTAAGAGCPAGSWHMDRLPDGSGTGIIFDTYSLSITPEAPRPVQSVACNVIFRLRTPKNLSYALAAYEYAGEAQLGAGTSASVIANLAFTGLGVAPVIDVHHKKLSSGPFTETVEPSELYWAPCDITSSIQVRTRLTLESTDPQATAQVGISSLRAIKLVTRSCDGAPLDAGVSDAGVIPDAGEVLPPLPGLDAGQPPQPPVPPAPDLPVVRVTTSGSACSGQTAKSVIAPDGRSFTVSFEDFVASSERTNAYCRVAIEVASPKGKSYALEGFSGQGSADLADGVSARLISLTDFTGAGVDLAKEKTTVIAGPRTGPISFSETFSAQQQNFSRCDASPGSLGLRFRVILDAPSGKSGRFSVGQLGAFRFVQRDCP